MTIQNRKLLLCCVLWLVFSINSAKAQSINSSFPTAVTTNEISGTIKARDVGDARLTSYYYTFNGAQGDIFVNVVTTNLNGDIDIFNADGLRPLTKIMVYADSAQNETGRVIYLRKPEKLILRVEGRTPNDDAATFKVKFAGSFVAVKSENEQEVPPVPELKSSNQTDIRVNSVGTIIEVVPKTAVPAKETVAAKPSEPENAVMEISIQKADEKTVIAQMDTGKKDDTKIEIAEDSIAKAEVKNTETTAEVKEATVAVDENPQTETVPNEEKTVSIREIPAETKAKKSVVKTKIPPKTKKARPEKIIEPNPLENIRLIVLFKDGKKIERLMSEVLKVGVDKGILTVISKNGSVGRYSILDVAKMTIE